MHKRLIIIFVIVGLFLSSCSTVGKATFNIKSLDKAKLEKVEAGELSILMYEFPSGSYIQSTFENLETGKEYIAGHYGTHLSINFVPPGNYQFKSWTNLNSTNLKKRLGSDAVYRYFEPFEVAAGETLYIGSIGVDRKKVKYTDGKKKGALTSVLLPFYDPNSTFKNAYSVKDKSKIINNRWIGWYHPELKGKMVTRLIKHNENVISNEVVRRKKLDSTSTSGKALKVARKDLESFIEEHGQEKIAGSPELSTKYQRKLATYSIRRRSFLQEYIKYRGEDNVKPELLEEKQKLDKQYELIDQLIERLKARNKERKLNKATETNAK